MKQHVLAEAFLPEPMTKQLVIGVLACVLSLSSARAPASAHTTERRPSPTPEMVKRFRLELHVPTQGGIYFSAWGDPEVVTDHDGSDGATVRYRRRYKWTDGCTWEATETLTPTSADRYKYSYREAPLSCPKGSSAATGAVTPRDGHVTVHPTSSTAPLTPLVAWAVGWSP